MGEESPDFEKDLFKTIGGLGLLNTINFTFVHLQIFKSSNLLISKSFPITIGTTHHFIIFAPAMNFEQLTDMKERVEALRGYL